MSHVQRKEMLYLEAAHGKSYLSSVLKLCFNTQGTVCRKGLPIINYQISYFHENDNSLVHENKEMWYLSLPKRQLSTKD